MTDLNQRLDRAVAAIQSGIYVSRSTITDLLVDLHKHMREPKTPVKRKRAKK